MYSSKDLNDKLLKYYLSEVEITAHDKFELINTAMMHHNILDEPEKETNPRTCPACGFQFPFWTFVRKYAMAFGFSRWSCQSCGEQLKCDYIKMQVWWLLGLVPCALLMGISLSYFDLGAWNIIFVFPFYAFVLLTLYYAKFERYEQE